VDERHLFVWEETGSTGRLQLDGIKNRLCGKVKAQIAAKQSAWIHLQIFFPLFWRPSYWDVQDSCSPSSFSSCIRCCIAAIIIFATETGVAMKDSGQNHQGGSSFLALTYWNRTWGSLPSNSPYPCRSLPSRKRLEKVSRRLYSLDHSYLWQHNAKGFMFAQFRSTKLQSYLHF